MPAAVERSRRSSARGFCGSGVCSWRTISAKTRQSAGSAATASLAIHHRNDRPKRQFVVRRHRDNRTRKLRCNHQPGAARGHRRTAGAPWNDVRQWRWQDVHRAVFPHSGLDSIGLLRPLVSRSRPGGGDWSTVSVGAIAVERPFDQTDLPGYRQIVDLSPANDSRFVDAVGESGHLLSPHYDDFLDDWRPCGTGRC